MSIDPGFDSRLAHFFCFCCIFLPQFFPFLCVKNPPKIVLIFTVKKKELENDRS